MNLKKVVTENDAGLRLDRWLATLEEIPSRSRAADLIEKGGVSLNGRALKASFKVQVGQEILIEIPEPQPTELKPLDRPIDVVFEDRDVIVVNKPAGLVVHPSAGHAQDTLVNMLLHHTKDLAMGFNERRPGIVHRIDRDTSGLIVIAKNDSAHHDLAAQFKAKSTHRVYWAIVAGRPASAAGTRRSFLARSAQDRKRFASQPTGKLAITHYKLLFSKADCSWLECRLETGRTHQIRVHLSEMGNPILGDPIYGGKSKKAAERLMLHATELGFRHPRTKEELRFSRSWPSEVLPFLEAKGFSP